MTTTPKLTKNFVSMLCDIVFNSANWSNPCSQSKFSTQNFKLERSFMSEQPISVWYTNLPSISFPLRFAGSQQNLKIASGLKLKHVSYYFTSLYSILKASLHWLDHTQLLYHTLILLATLIHSYPYNILLPLLTLTKDNRIHNQVIPLPDQDF